MFVGNNHTNDAGYSFKIVLSNFRPPHDLLFLMEEETALCITKSHALTKSKILSITQDLIVNLQHLLSLLDGCSFYN